MKPTDIANAYDQITHLWERKAFDRHNGIEQHKRAVAFVEQRGQALDVGCGCTGRFIELLVNKGFKPEGVDLSKKMVELAQIRHPDIRFRQQDICEWEPPDHYDFITAWDSLWHVPLAQQEPVLTKLIAALNPNGVLIFSFGGTDAANEHLDDTMGPELYYATLGINGYLELLLRLGCVCRHLEYDQHPELHCYAIVQKTDQPVGGKTS